MIRKCTKEDQTLLLDYLGREPAINLFIIGDMLAYGFDTDYQDIWCDQAENGELHSVLLRFHEIFIPYHDEDYGYVPDLIQLIKQYPHKSISGKESILLSYRAAFPDFTFESTYFAHLPGAAVDVAAIPTGVEPLTKDNLAAGNVLMMAVFPATVRDEARLIADLESGLSRGFVRKNQAGEVIAIASTAVETASAGMIVGVCTREDARGKGYGKEIVQTLCNALLKEGKTPCLFFENPIAGQIYHDLGFVDIDKWGMMDLKQEE